MRCEITIGPPLYGLWEISMNAILLDEMRPEDWDEVRAIYAEGIATGHATFEREVPAYEAWNASRHPFCRLVARDCDRLCGWATLAPVSSRPVYAGVAEAALYVAASHRGTGVGRMLCRALIECSERNRIWTLQSSVFEENTGSIALHREFGFRLVGRRERIGILDGVWRDTLLFERRSLFVGVE